MTNSLDEQHRKALARAESLPPFHQTQTAADHQRRARERADFARDLFQRVLANAPHMTSEDARITAIADDNVRVGGRALFSELEKLTASDPATAAKISFGLDFLTSGLFIGASRATVSDSGMALYRRESTKHAREEKPRKPVRVAQANAIKSALRDKYAGSDMRPGDLPAATAIIQQVNAMLRADSKPQMKVDTLRKSAVLRATLAELFPSSS